MSLSGGAERTFCKEVEQRLIELEDNKCLVSTANTDSEENFNKPQNIGVFMEAEHERADKTAHQEEAKEVFGMDKEELATNTGNNRGSMEKIETC